MIITDIDGVTKSILGKSLYKAVGRMFSSCCDLKVLKDGIGIIASGAVVDTVDCDDIMATLYMRDGVLYYIYNLPEGVAVVKAVYDSNKCNYHFRLKRNDDCIDFIGTMTSPDIILEFDDIIKYLLDSSL